MSRRELPRIASSLLSATLPADWRQDIVRDVEEAWAARAERRPLLSAFWLAGQIASFGLRFLPIRLAEASAAAGVSSLDLRLTLRAIRRAPGLSLLAVVALSLGIGATAGAFTFIRGAFFVELPFPGGERIYVVEDYNATRSYALRVDAREYLRRRELVRSFEALGAYYSRAMVVGGERRVPVRFVTPDLLEMTAVQPSLGRLPDAGDAGPGALPVVLLPHFLWVDLTGASPDVVGSTVPVGGVDRTVVGVMPEGFGMPWGNELWIPLDPTSTDEPLQMLGKLREGVDVETARAELAVVARPDPAELQSPDDEVEHLITKLSRPVTGDAQLLFLAAPLGALVLLLLVMATNVATVVLARNAERSGELAVRVALGASRRRVVGQLVLEVAALVVVAAAVGLALARWVLSLFEAWVDLPFWVDLSLHPLAVGFTVGLAALATLVAGVVPALRTTSGRLHESLKDGARGASGVRFGRTTDIFVVAELTVCVGFLSSAAILGEGLFSLGRTNERLPLAETMVAQVYFGWPDELRDPEADLSPGARARLRDEFLAAAVADRETIVRRARELPGVRMAAAASRFPGDESERMRVDVDGGGPRAAGTAEVVGAGSGWFELLDARPLRGRVFTAAERAGDADVAVVDEPFVRAHLGGGPGVGRRFRLVPEDGKLPRPGPWLEVVGVVPDLGFAVADPGQSGTVYRPLDPTTFVWVGLRGDGDPAGWAPRFTELVRTITPDAQVQGTQTLAALVSLPRTVYRSLGVGFLALGGIALLLSAASLHALTACAVTRRTRELGIRRALGARTTGLIASMARRTAAQLVVGAVLGAGLSTALLRLAAIFPWRLGSGNPAVLGAVPLVLGAAVLAALVGPLRRALTIRPAEALRHE